MSFYSIADFIRENYPEYWGIQTYPSNICVRIHKVNEEWGVFSNFAHTPIPIGTLTFKSSEQLFQLMKFRDEEPVKAVWAANNPKMTAKKWEKTHRRDDWGKIIIDVMKYCLQQKYDNSITFRGELERSQGKYIVEDQTTFPKKQPDAWGAKLQDDTFVGPNILGRLLMELREHHHLNYTLPDDALTFMQWLK